MQAIVLLIGVLEGSVCGGLIHAALGSWAGVGRLAFESIGMSGKGAIQTGLTRHEHGLRITAMHAEWGHVGNAAVAVLGCCTR